MREQGFYWIRIYGRDDIEVARWCQMTDCCVDTSAIARGDYHWEIVGNEFDFSDKEVEVLSGRLEEPQPRGSR
jgi:hypothetical protein